MANNSINISSDSILSEIPNFTRKGISEFTVHDPDAASDRKRIFAIADAVEKYCPDVFITLPVDVEIIDQALVKKFMNICCSIEISLRGRVKDNVLLFDKKLFAKKIGLLNEAGLVFGFDMDWGMQKGDSFRAFRDRLDFALTLYPNHIDFPQFDTKEFAPAPTGTFSSKDLEFAREMAFACKSFYSCGRAVPWFNSVTKVLKISASTFFSDFGEWMNCNSCSFESGFDPENSAHEDIEKMQINFLAQKFEEKHKSHFFEAVTDMVAINGAFSRAVTDGSESIIDTSYNPDYLLSPFAMDIARFCDTCSMEPCKVKIFLGEDSPDYKIL